MLLLFPYATDVPVRRRSPVKVLLVAAVTIASSACFRFDGWQAPVLLDPRIVPGPWGVFVHQDVAHLLATVVALWAMVDAARARLGAGPMVASFVGIGVLAQGVEGAVTGAAPIGADAAIAGLFGLVAMLHPGAQLRFLWVLWIWCGRFELSVRVVCGYAIVVVMCPLAAGPAPGSIAYLFGFAAGAASGAVLRRFGAA